MAWIGVVILGGALGGCKWSQTAEGQSPDEMLSKYREKIVSGTSLRAARAMMEADGFAVTEETGAGWKGKKNFTFLRCVRDDGIVIKRRWEFALMHNGQFVTEVDIRPGLVYP
jgi:hypothetical protein